MTQDEIIEMARQAGFTVGYGSPALPKHEAFAKLVAAKERKACAERAWIALVKHKQPWNVRQDVTEAILKKDEA